MPSGVIAFLDLRFPGIDGRLGQPKDLLFDRFIVFAETVCAACPTKIFGDRRVGSCR
jgi:hypothetical protein